MKIKPDSLILLVVFLIALGITAVVKTPETSEEFCALNGVPGTISKAGCQLPPPMSQVSADCMQRDDCTVAERKAKEIDISQRTDPIGTVLAWLDVLLTPFAPCLAAITLGLAVTVLMQIWPTFRTPAKSIEQGR